MSNTQVVFFTTFSLFLFEALLHYNVGRNSGKQGPFQLVFPRGKDLLELLAILGFFSILNALLSEYFIEGEEESGFV